MRFICHCCKGEFHSKFTEVEPIEKTIDMPLYEMIAVCEDCFIIIDNLKGPKSGSKI